MTSPPTTHLVCFFDVATEFESWDWYFSPNPTMPTPPPLPLPPRTHPLAISTSARVLPDLISYFRQLSGMNGWVDALINKEHLNPKEQRVKRFLGELYAAAQSRGAREGVKGNS